MIEARHRARMRFAPWLIAVVSLAGPALRGAEEPERPHRELRREAETAYQRKDYRAALASITAAVKQRPDAPQYLHNLAALSALTGNRAAALAALQRIAELGVVANIERDPDLATLQGTPELQRLLSRFAENREPRGQAETIAELPGRTGVIEGIAVRERTGDIFLSDVHHRCIWRRTRDGQIARFTAEDDELSGIFGLAIDEARNTLWAVTTAVPEMAGYEPTMKGHAALAEFNLTTGELGRVIPVPNDGREHTLGDLCVGPDGSIYATDSKAPVIWHFLPDAEEPQKLVDSPAFGSLQGIVLERGVLLVSDYSNGLFAIDVSSRTIRDLAAPANTTLVGIDGLIGIPGGLVCIQNGVTPQRLLRVTLSPELDKIVAVSVVAAALPHLTDLSLGTIAHGNPIVIAGAGWDIFDPMKAKEPPPHTVRILQVALPE